MTKQSQCISWVHQTVRKSNKPHLFSYNSPRETQSDAKGPPSLCFLLKYPFTSLILWEIYTYSSSFTKKFSRWRWSRVAEWAQRISDQRNVGGRYFMYLNVGRNYSLIRNRSFPPKVGKIRRGQTSLTTDIDSYNRPESSACIFDYQFSSLFFAKLERKYKPQSEVCET